MMSCPGKSLIFNFLLLVILIINKCIIYGVQIPSNSTTNTTLIPLTSLNNGNIKNVTYCSPIQNVPNGSLRFSNSLTNNSYIHGTIATLTCNDGYQHIGDLISTCREGTNWTKIGSCVKIDTMDCRPMDVSHENGYIIYVAPSNGNLMKSGTIAKLVCNSKSSPTGVTEIKCNSDGWDKSATFGKCLLKNDDERLKRELNSISNINTQLTCIQLNVDHGIIQYYYDGTTNNGNYPSGTTAILSCESGYEAVGVTSCLCTNGIWNPIIGSCKIEENNNQFLQISTLIPLGDVTRNRRQIIFPTVPSLGLPSGVCYFPLPMVLGGTISYSNNQILPPYSSGTIATLTCNSGLVQGISSATCENGVWSVSSLGTCNTTNNLGISGLPLLSQSSCTIPVGSELGGYITYTQGASYGPFPHMTIATLVCDLGSTVLGASTTTCMNGIWTPSALGKCILPGTNNLIGSTSPGLNNFITPTLPSTTVGQCVYGVIDPLNGRISYSNGATFGPFPAGTIATLICNEGYVPLTPFTSVCTSGVFPQQSTVPTCISTSISNNTGQLNEFVIKKVNCKGIEEIENGIITYEGNDIYKNNNSYSHGTTAYLFCYFNYNPIGYGKTSCNNGQWKPKNIGKCVLEKKKCNEISIDGNNNFEGVVLKYLDEYIEIKCDNGYKLIGVNKIKCLKNGEWDIDFKNNVFCSKIKNNNVTKEVDSNVKKTETIYNYKPCPPPWDGNLLYNYKYSEISLSNSLLKNGMLPHNTYIFLTCKNSQLYGSDNAHCIDGSWLPQLGICKIIEEKKTSPTSCKELIVPKNGIIKFIESSEEYKNEIGTQGVLQCKKGYKIRGNPLVTCTINGWVPITGLGNCEILFT